MKWSVFFRTILGMWGTFLLYKMITLSLLYAVPALQSKAYYQFIYFAIVMAIIVLVLYLTKRMFKTKVTLTPKMMGAKKTLSLFIVPIILFGVDFFATLPEVFSQSIYLIFVSFANALGAGLFEEIRDRGFGTIGFNLAIPDSKWKPLVITLCTSFLFATTHYLNLLLPAAPTFEAVQQQVFYTFFLGMVLSVLTMRTGTVFYAILFHIMNNLVAWTPQSDLASASSWDSLIIIYGLVPLIYSLWCLRPSKIEENSVFFVCL